MNIHQKDELDMLAAREADFQCTAWLDDARNASMLLQANPVSCTKPLNAMCREKLVLWCYAVAATFHVSDEVVEVAISMVDRYLSSDSGKHVIANRPTFRLVFMTSLYVACKAIEKSPISLREFQKIGHGTITVQEMIQMEQKLLFGLNWRLYRPTTIGILQAVFKGLPKYSLLPDERQRIWSFMRVYCRLAMKSSELVGVQASAFVFAAVANAFHRFAFSDKAFAQVSRIFSKHFHLSLSSNAVIGTERVISASAELQQFDPRQSRIKFSKQFFEADYSQQLSQGVASPTSVAHLKHF